MSELIRQGGAGRAGRHHCDIPEPGHHGDIRQCGCGLRWKYVDHDLDAIPRWRRTISALFGWHWPPPQL